MRYGSCLRTLWTCAATVGVLCANLTTSLASQVIFFDRNVRVHQNFADLKIHERAEKPAAFFDAARLKFEPAGKDQSKEVREFASAFLAKHFKLASSRNDAKYLIQMRTEAYIDYATRNDKRVPSNTLIMISICRLSETDPMAALDIERNCQNLNFSFFSTDTILEKLKFAQDAWWSHISTE